MSIDTILFDLDGTVADSLPLIKRTYYTVFQEMGIPWGNDDVMRLIGLPLREIGRMMAGAGKEEEFFDTYQRHYRERHNELMGLFPDTRNTLNTLKRHKFSMGVVTSKSRVGTDLTLSLLNLSDFFNIVVTVDDTAKHKPNPEPVLFALDKLKKVPEQAVYVGDSPFDIMAGNSAGAATAAVTWGMAAQGELEEQHPSLVISYWSELLLWLGIYQGETR